LSLPRISDDLGQIKSEEKRGGKKRGNERGIGEKTFIYVGAAVMVTENGVH
jgi:hypothetical protein